MAPSTDRRGERARGAGVVVALLVALCLALPARAPAEDGLVRVHESALNDFAAAMQPLSVTRSWSFTLWIWAPNPFLFGLPTPMPVPFACVATATVSGVAFDVKPGSASVSGSVTGTVCGFPYTSPLSSPVSIVVDPVARALVIRPLGTLAVSATVNVLGIKVTAPFGAINLASSFGTMSIPLDTSAFEIETPSGPRTLRLGTRGHQLSLHDGYFEVRADAFFR